MKLYFTVDRIEGQIAVLVGDNGQTIEVARRGLREGDVLYLRGRTLVQDRAEKRRRIARAHRELEQMKRSDPGGNLQL